MALMTNGNDTSDDSMLHPSNTALLCVIVLLSCACATANTGRTRLSMPSACITPPSTALHTQRVKAARRTTRRGAPAYVRINTSTQPAPTPGHKATRCRPPRDSTTSSSRLPTSRGAYPRISTTNAVPCSTDIPPSLAAHRRTPASRGRRQWR